ncbi:MAG: CAP domain-containing protein [Patescibacteria group bacterium]|nr:CAP domain-containing protein [Patescibacteria group bacterium]
MEKLKNFFYHLFIPNEKNNYKAKALHTDFLFIYLIIAVFLTFSFKKINVNNVLGFATDITVQKLFELTNKERQKNNLKSLNYNENLSKAAYEKALDMFSKNYWAHFGPNGETPWDFILKNNYQYEYAGENLAKNFLFSNGVVSAWMNSPSHRENILKKEYTDVGFAVVNGILNGEETTLVVQMFANPLNRNIKTNNYLNENTKTFVKKYNNYDNQKNVVLAQTTNNKNLLNWQIVFNSQILFFIFLIIALILDIYFAEKFGIIRIEGKNIAHFIFIFFILISLLIISKGSII